MNVEGDVQYRKQRELLCEQAWSTYLAQLLTQYISSQFRSFRDCVDSGSIASR
jgi:hypothetical protein